MNTVISMDVQNLSRPLTTIQAMQFCGVRVMLNNTPKDGVDFRITIYKPDGEHFVAIPLSPNANGDWEGFILGGCFPSEGRGKYHIHYRDIDGHVCSGGKGEVLTTAFEPMAGGEVTPTGDIVVMELPDASGKAHRILAVNKGTKEAPDWSWQMDD